MPNDHSSVPAATRPALRSPKEFGSAAASPPAIAASTKLPRTQRLTRRSTQTSEGTNPSYAATVAATSSRQAGRM